jgi:hypothetical protein
MRIAWIGSGELEVKESAKPVSARRGEQSVPAFPAAFLQSKLVSLHKTLEIALPVKAEARAARALPVIAFDVETDHDEAALVALRYPSNAIAFHAGTALKGKRGTAGSARRLQFRIPVRQAQTPEGRRGLISEGIKATILKVAKPVLEGIAGLALQQLARRWEERVWDKHRLKEGWFRVLPPTDDSLQIQAHVPDGTERKLLFLHGTFSDAASAFAGLTRTDFFVRVKQVYGDRIFAFNHFTISKSPEENVRAMLSALPKGSQTFDVITHSRGGLVLRTLVERSAKFQDLSQRFQLGRAVLVASPNDGTPLATPERWDKTVGWVANLVEIINKFGPDNPFLTAAEFVSDALVWLAHHITGDLPGLRAMDAGGETVQELQGTPAPPADSYSALVANFQPERALWQRIVDVGVDQFFGGANDLVVPTEGGWRIDHDGRFHISPDAVGCFGPGGNLAPEEPSAVIHTSFFSRTETATFLERALSGQPHNLTAIDLSRPLPDHRFARGAVGVPPPAAVSATRPGPKAAPSAPIFLSPSTSAADTFHLIVLDAQKVFQEQNGQTVTGHEDGPSSVALLYASYGGARAVEPFGLRGGEAGRRFQQIIDIHERIKDYTDRQKGSLPSDAEMLRFGQLLFATLFPGEVKRLYDTARSLQRDRKLDLVFTSMVSWVAEKPWEFAYDPTRRSFLATEEIHFVRNVLTAVPGDSAKTRSGPLEILVVSAQPLGLAELSVEEETEVIRRGFDTLIEAKLAEVDVLPRATVPALHAHLSTGKYNVVHFIGHGTFNEEQKKGYLVFEDGRGGRSFLDERSAREVFCQRGLDLVFLNACQTSEADPADFNKGMAQALVAHGIPALVANQYSVLDVSATSFAQFFYWGLARGMSLGAAAREARISVNYSLQGDLIDWAVPVLYARDPNRSLTFPTEPVTPAMPMVSVARERRGPVEKRVRIALWDIDRSLPKLNTLVTRYNQVQTLLEFVMADLSAPLDSFEVQEKNGKRIMYFKAAQLAHRLQSKPGQLNVDYLLGITRRRMLGAGKSRVHEWCPTDDSSEVLLLSLDGLAQSAGPGSSRALTNAIAGLLARALTKAESHDKGATSCPLHVPAGRKDLELKQKFDRNCRKILQRRMPDGLVALEALLALGEGPKMPVKT